MDATDDLLAALRGRRVVLCVTGGISAYKAVEVCRRLVDAGAHVAPVLTEDAQRFIGALTFSALASEPARTSLFDGLEPIPHTRLGQGADLILVAPATAKALGKYAHGISDDLVSATLLATRAPVLVAPAMHTEMWEHPAVADNLTTLRARGVHVIGPEEGRRAGGDVGAGRLADPARIVEAAARVMARDGDLAGLRVVITAGGTREPIDPVRFLGNRSSGRQGVALARAAAARGADVTLVAANVSLPDPAGVKVVRVETTEELRDAVVSAAVSADAVVMAAAPADFRPVTTSQAKIKKSGDTAPTLELTQTPDILAELSRDRSRPGQVVVGFAAETGDDTGSVLDHARAKLARKGCDLLVVNDVAGGAVFGAADNQAVILSADGDRRDVPFGSKTALAHVIWDEVASRLQD